MLLFVRVFSSLCVRKCSLFEESVYFEVFTSIEAAAKKKCWKKKKLSDFHFTQSNITVLALPASFWSFGAFRLDRLEYAGIGTCVEFENVMKSATKKKSL